MLGLEMILISIDMNVDIKILKDLNQSQIFFAVKIGKNKLYETTKIWNNVDSNPCSRAQQFHCFSICACDYCPCLRNLFYHSD
jgi:hypothetical protein